MPRRGFNGRDAQPTTLLDELHAPRCDGQTFAKCQPVVTEDPDGLSASIEVVFMEWCGECGAADYEVV